jgi:outer membrane immunogenic protein
MKRFSIGSILLAALFVHPVIAADFPIKAPTYETVYNWTGFYAGVNFGAGPGHSTGDASFDPRSRLDTATVTPASQDIGGVLGGVQAGYNAQINKFIFGVESDIQATGQKGGGIATVTLTQQLLCLAPCAPPAPLVTNAPLNFAQSVPWFGTFRGRIGFTPVERTLLYATGGLAYGQINGSTTLTIAPQACIAPCTPNPGGSIVSTFGETKVGWALGGGIEGAIIGNWTGKIEYLHLDFGSSGGTLVQVATLPFVGNLQSSSGRFSEDMIRFGLNYRFGNEVVAKY